VAQMDLLGSAYNVERHSEPSRVSASAHEIFSFFLNPKKPEIRLPDAEILHLLGLSDFVTGATKPLRQNIFRDFTNFV